MHYFVTPPQKKTARAPNVIFFKPKANVVVVEKYSLILIHFTNDCICLHLSLIGFSQDPQNITFFLSSKFYCFQFIGIKLKNTHTMQ